MLKQLLAGATLTLTALGTAALTATPAQADVPKGTYAFTTTSLGSTTSRVVVLGNKIVIPTVFGVQSLPLHKTKHGAYADSNQSRYTFTSRGGKLYTGKVMLGPIQIGTTRLIKR